MQRSISACNRRATACILLALGCFAGPSPADATPPDDPPAAAAAAQPAERGRDPWVFRCIFEDRTRVVVLAPAKDLWIVFNPYTCGIYKVWHGAMIFRGKVWDFSQDNCESKGESLLQASNTLLDCDDPETHASDTKLAMGWTATNVDPNTLAFHGDGAVLTSPIFDTRGWVRLFVRFDERSRRGPIRVEISNDAGHTWDAQWFHSCLHVDSDDAWQWNFKELAPRSERTRMRFVQEHASYEKSLRNIRVFGDRPAWSGTDTRGDLRVEPVFKGYRFLRPANATASSGGSPSVVVETVELMYDLHLTHKDRGDQSIAATAHVRHRIDCRAHGLAGAKITESILVEALPEGVSVMLTPPDGTHVQRSINGRPATSLIIFQGGAPVQIEITTEANP